ncbi:MAG: hypothetical protein ACRD8A_16085 [Candidatus Acidiferrales bacterium]
MASRKLDSGSSVDVIAITGKPLPPDEERQAAKQDTQFARVVLADHDRKAKKADAERFGCDYNVKVWYHESLDVDAGGPSNAPNSMPASPPPIADRTAVGYELRNARTNRVLARAAAPPRTMYVRQGRRVFDPYPLFANQIIKKLNSASKRSNGRW